MAADADWSIFHFSFLSWYFSLLKKIAGWSQIRIGYSKTSQTGDLQSSSVPHSLRVQYRRAEFEHWVQRVDSDYCRNDCKYRTSTNLYNANLQFEWRWHFSGRNWWPTDAQSRGNYISCAEEGNDNWLAILWFLRNCFNEGCNEEVGQATPLFLSKSYNCTNVKLI